MWHISAITYIADNCSLLALNISSDFGSYAFFPVSNTKTHVDYDNHFN